MKGIKIFTSIFKNSPFFIKIIIIFSIIYTLLWFIYYFFINTTTIENTTLFIASIVNSILVTQLQEVYKEWKKTAKIIENETKQKRVKVKVNKIKKGKKICIHILN